jgi:parallel beta-helix repeat protein
MAVNLTTGMTGNVKVTSTSWFIVRGNAGIPNAVKVDAIANRARVGAVRTSTTSGSIWVNQTYTTDLHLHQYNGSQTFSYFACANDTAPGTAAETCSEVKTDLLQHAGMAPQVTITEPLSQYYDRYVPMNYSALSPNGYNISNYTLNLYNATTLVLMQQLNFSSSPLYHSYYWDASNNTAGEYVIGVQACDLLGQCAFSYSENFSVSYGNITLIAPANNTLLDRQLNITLNVTFTGSPNSTWNVSFYDATTDLAGVLLGTVYSLQNGAYATYEWLGLTAGTVYKWFVIIINGAGAHNSSVWQFTPNDEPKVINMRIENITGSCAIFRWDNEPNMDWVSFKVGNDILELRSITSVADNWTTCDLYPNQEYVFEFQTGDSFHTVGDYHNFSFRTLGWNPIMSNYSYRRLITINHSLIAATVDNQAFNLTLNDTNFQYYDSDNYVYYPSFLHLNYTTLKDIRFMDYYDVVPLDFNITYVNIPGDGGLSYQTAPTSHYVEGNVSDEANMYDEDWSTFGTPNFEARYYYNYTIPAGAKTTSLFRLYAGEWLWDTELESDCWGGTDLAFMAQMNYTNASIATYCMNMTDPSKSWIGVHYSWAPFTPFASKYFYETMMTWQYDTRLNINVVPEYFRYLDQINTPGISNNYSVQLWMYYGNPNETVYGGSTPTMAGISQNVFILGDETEPVLGAPTISNLANGTLVPVGPAPTGTNISWDVDQIVDNRLEIATNPFIIGSYFIWRIVNTTTPTSEHLIGNAEHTILLDTSPSEFINITNVSCSNASYVNNFTVNITANPVTITFLNVETTEYLDWNVTFTENKSWVRNSGSPEFQLEGLVTDTQYWVRANAYGDTGNDTDILSFILGTLPTTPSIVITNYTEDRPTSRVIICANLTDMNGALTVDVSFQYFNGTATDFSTTAADTVANVGEVCKIINVNFGENMTYRAKADGGLNGVGYSDPYYDLFNLPYEFFVGNPSKDPTNDLPRQYCPPKADGTANTAAQCYEQQGYREGSQQLETFMYIETNITGVSGTTLTAHLINGSTEQTFNLVQGTYFNYTTISGLQSGQWYTLYITDGSAVVVLNLTKPGMIHLNNYNRTDTSKYISFGGSGVTVNSTYFYMKNPGVYNSSAYQWCQNAPGGNIYDCMSVQYWGGGREAGVDPSLSGTQYDRGQFFRGGIPNGELRDTGILEYTRNASVEVLGDQRFCFAFTVYFINESIIPTNNVTNYYYRYWTEVEHYSDYMGYDQPSTFHQSNLFKWQYDEVALTRDWRSITGTNTTKQLSVLSTPKSTFQSTYNQSLKVGYVEGFSVNLSGDDIYQSGLYLDGQWINQRIGKYQQGFVIYNLPDNATLAGMDSDSDGLNDKNELFENYTNPYSYDTDEDGMWDGDEIRLKYDPNIYNNHTAPNITLTSPQNNSHHNNYINLSANISAVSGIYNITLYINGIINNSQIFSYFINNTQYGNYLNFSQGTYNFSYFVVDNTGLNYTSELRFFEFHLIIPNVSMVLPVNNTVTNISDVNFSANVTDYDVGVLNMSVYVFNNATGALVASGNYSTPTEPISALIGIVLTLTDGVYKWFLEAFDAAGNMFRSGNYTLTVDTIIPNITIITPNNSVYNNGTIWVNISYNDTNFYNVWYTLNGTTRTYTAPFQINLSDGNYTIIAYGNDTAGNINSTQFNFLVDHTNITYCKNLTRENITYTLQTDILGVSPTCFRITANGVTFDGNGYRVSGLSSLGTSAIISNQTYGINITGFKSLDNFYNGITLFDVNNSYIGRNSIYANVYGISITRSHNITIYNNTVYQQSNTGIYLNASVNSTLSSNLITGSNLVGMKIYGNSSYNRIFNNSILSSASDGIDIYSDSSYNIIDDNALTSNTGNGIYIYERSENNTFNNNTMVQNGGLTASPNFNIKIGPSIKNNYFVNQWFFVVNGKAIMDNSSNSGTAQNYLIYNNSMGKIEWTNTSFVQNLSIRTTLIVPTVIRTGFNYAFANASAITLSRINSSAKVTLYNTPSLGMSEPVVLVDGQRCYDCYNFTDLLAPTVVFNVSHWSNYSLGESNSTPSVVFVRPTLNESSNPQWFTSGIFTRWNYTIINVTATDPTLQNITIYLFNSTHDLVNFTNSTTSPLYIQFYNLVEGMYFFNATACNGFDNCNSTETRNITVDLTKPNATDLLPIASPPEVYLNYSNVNISVNMSDAVGIEGATLYLYNSTGWPLGEEQNVTTTYTNAIGVLEAIFGVMNTLADDIYHWFFVVWDLAGNTNVTETRNFTVDTTFPYFIVHNPVNGTYDNGTVLLNITVNDTNVYKISYDYNGTSMTYTVPVYMYTSDGDWNVTITAIDMAGNTNSTQINFSVDNINLTYCKNLTRAGKVYTLMANLTGQSGICFDIRNDNITLNGSNNYISGDGVPTGSDDAGIYSNGYKNLTVENFNGVSDFDIGITLYSVNNSIIRNVNMSSNVFRFGLYLLQNTEGNQIYNNIMDSNEIGMRILNGNNYIIYGNIFRSNTLTEGLRLTGNNNTFNNNTVNDNNNNGLYLSTFNNGIISNNMIYGNGVSTDSNAIWVDNSNNNIFISNTISSNADTGIEFSSSSGNILLNNTIIDNSLYSILDSSGIGSANYLVYNNTFGEIKWINDSFLDNLTLFGNLSFNASLNLSFNFASVSPSQFSIGNINSSANITFYGTPSTGFPYPKILRDGRVCSECYKFTALTDPTVIFNVSSWSNYSLGEDPVHPINCSVLDQENTTYFLEADILRHDGSCFLITANNVTLNGQGHIVNGIGNSNQYAIYALNVWNVTIFNFTNISSWGTGIKINATLDAAIRDTNLSSNLFDIYLTNVLRSNFENITLSGSTNGLYLNGSVENNSFINIDFISHSEYSIYDNASLRNSLSYSNSNGTIFFTSDVFLTNLTFRGNLSAPYQINMSTNNILLNTSGIRDSYMNSSLNISFYVTSIIPFANPRINRNGIACVDCYKLTSFYHVPDVIINTTSDGRYQIVDADNVPPVINFTYPTPITTQLINTSYISINVSAVDSYLMNVTVFLYNANHIFINASTGSTNPYYILLTNGTGLVSGKYYINATACDTSDLCNSTETREIYIDTIIPNVTLISPVNNTISTNLTYNFTVNITDNILSSGGFTGLCYQESANVSTSCGGLDTGIYNIFGIWVDPYYIIDGSWGTSNGYTIWNNQYIDINYRKPNNTTGANWTIAGGNTTSPVSINAIYNVTIPSDCWAYSTTTLSLRLVGMNNFEQYFKCFNSTDWKTIYFINETSRAFYEEAIWWKYDLVNISGIANASLYIYNSSGLYNQTNMTYTQGTAQAILGIPVTLVDGFYYWFYRVIDFALNIRQSETWNLTVDSHKPTISLVPPTNITGTYTNTSTIYVNISSSDLTLQNVTIRFYNSAHALYAWHTWNNSASLNYTFVTPSVVDAIYYYNASSCDQSGNCSYSETRNITIDTITPTIDYVTPPTEIDGSVIAYNSILINLTSTDLNTKNITVRIYNSTHDLVIMNTSNNTFASYFAYNNSLPYGFYYYNATSCDAAYNCNNTATRNITLSICPLGMPGDGSIATPCQITSWLTLNATKQNPSLNYILMNNLSSADTGYIGIGSNWTTVGLTYSATFNGNNKNISDLIVNTTGGNTGFIGYLTGTIRDLTLINGSVSDRSNPTGGLVGIVNAGGIIINCHFIGGTVTGIGTGYVGGLVGSLNNGAIYNSSASATVTSSGDRVGGLAGYMGGTLIYNSSASGNVTSTGSGLVGGLVGQQTGGTIDYSYFIGNINANTSVGGLVGSTVAIISHSYAVANITGSGNQVGGLIGFSSGAISNSYSIINGRINGSESVGTFIGRKIGGSVSNVYSIVDINSSIYGKNYVGFIGNNTGGLISYTYLIIRNNSAGNITFLELITGGTGELIGNNITISNNYVYVNASQSYLNKSANITLSGLSTSFINPRVVRDLINNCNTTTNPSCYNFTDLNAGMVRFNVSSWNGYYSIDGDISTDIQFVYPTDNHTVYINRSYILANVTAHAICTGAVSCLQNITIQLFNSSRVLINSSTINNNENFYLNFTNGTSGYASGIYYIGAYACNNLTNTCNITTNRTIYLDTITPNATLLSPTNNTLSTNVTYNFTVNLSDNILSPSVGGVANATLYIYNQTGDLYNRTTSENYDQGTANAILGIPVTLIDGIYSWFYRIIDYALNEFQSDTWNLTVDSHAPILIINYPISGGTYAPTPTLIDFNYTALDSHLDSCWYRNETMTYNISLPGCINTSIAWPEGVHTLHLWANDSLGNVSYTNVTFLITNPTVTLRNPINNSYLPYDTNILFNYTVLSSAELNNCDLWGTWNGGWHKNQTNSTAVSNVTQNNFTTINIPDGHYFWNVFCNDSIGVGKFAMDNFTLTIDTIYPTVNITSPLNATDLSTTNLWINYTYNDTNMDSCWWTNNSGAINHSITCGTNISYTAIEGINNITVYVNDSAGHINNSTIAFYLDTQGPIVNITYPINSSIFGSVPVQVNYTRFDNHLDSCWWTNNSGLTNNSLPGCINISYAASEGWNTIIVYANDTLGNVGFDDVTFLVDTTYPTLLNITYPLNITYNSLVDHIDFTAYDLTNSTCWYSNSSINSTAQACGSGNIAWTVLGIYPITGNNHWYAYVNDSFGRINYTEVYFNYNFSIIVVPTQPSAEGGSSVAGGPDVNFSAVANASQGLYNVSLYVYNDTTFTPGNLFNYSFVQYPAGTFTAPWDMIITFVRGVYYWWFEAFDVFGNVYTGNVSNLTVNVPIVTIISPPDGSTTFSNNNTQLLELVTDQLIDFCGYSLNGADNVTFYPNIEISVPYGMNTITVYCHNENGTGYHTHSFQRYDYPSLDLSITSPREGQMYKDPKQILSWQYNTSYGIVAWNYTLNGDLQPIVASGTKIEFPLTANTVRICGNATMPLPAPYYNNFTQLSECDDVSFLVTDKLTAAVTDMTLYLWASLFIVILAIFFAYIQGADSMFQFLVRVIWYSGEMLIGFTIIVEGIKVIRTLTGIAP